MTVSRKFVPRILIFLIMIFVARLVSSCDAGPTEPVATGTAAPITTETQPAVETIASTESQSDTTSEPVSSSVETTQVLPGDIKQFSTAVTARTPVPTPTPTRLDQEIAQLTNELGIAGTTFLGITAENWIDMGISALIVLLGYFLGTRLLKAFLRWLTKRTHAEIDEAVLKKISPDLEWLVILFFTRYAVLRLDFLCDGFRKVLEDVFFGLGLILFTIIGYRLIRYGVDWYRADLKSDADRLRLSPVIDSVQRVLVLVLLIIMLSIGLAHFGVNLGVLSITILVLLVIFSIGAKDVISDAISGFVILIEQPFRVDDGVQIENFETWGKVMEIRTRTTRILTRDNREVIIPNTQILNNRIVNTSYPNPKVRLQVDLHITYDTDLEKSRQVILDALDNVDGVLQDQDREVLFIGFYGSARRIRVRWWVADNHQPWIKIDKVCTAINAALDQAGIEIPVTVDDLYVRMESSQSIN